MKNLFLCTSDLYTYYIQQNPSSTLGIAKSTQQSSHLSEQSQQLIPTLAFPRLLDYPLINSHLWHDRLIAFRAYLAPLHVRGRLGTLLNDAIHWLCRLLVFPFGVWWYRCGRVLVNIMHTLRSPETRLTLGLAAQQRTERPLHGHRQSPERRLLAFRGRIVKLKVCWEESFRSIVKIDERWPWRA